MTRIVALTSTFLAVAALAGGVGSAAAAPSPFHRVGGVPAVPRDAARLGALPADTSLHYDVVLQPRDPAALESFVEAVSTPGNPLYRHYLRRGEFAGRFGPTQQTIDQVMAALRAQGLQPGQVSPNGLSISVTASAQATERGLHTSFERFRLQSGPVGFANTTPPQLPASVAGEVSAIVGLNGLARAHPQLVGASAPRTTGPQPCTAANNEATATGAYTPDQLASRYDITGLYGTGDLGSGATVALFELEKNLSTDISQYASCFGVTPNVSSVPVDGGATGSAAGKGEAALDIEDVIGLAPQATIKVYQGPNTSQGIFDTYSRIVTDDTAQVISTSWGLCELESAVSDLQAESTVFEQAAAQGQTVLAAAGDTGSEDCGDSQNPGLAVDDPGSQPYVTSVGGTTLTSTDETVWNDGDGAGGGGISAIWPMPSYQSGIASGSSSGVPCGAPTASDCREVPDVSADAALQTGYVVFFNGGWTAIGGTSAAAPLWGALIALGDASGIGTCATKPIGFLNPSVYTLASSSTAYASAFNDITSGNNDFTGRSNGLYAAGIGYDMASGLGTPKAYTSSTVGLIPQLCHGLVAPPTGATPTVSNVSPTTGGTAGGTVVTITGSHFSGGTPTVHFDNVSATSVVVDSDTQITVTAPAGTGTVPVTVANQYGMSDPTTSPQYQYIAPPAISSLTPASGPPGGGTLVTINGSGFQVATPTVAFGGTPATNVRVVSSGQLQATAPAGTGSVGVTVSNIYGTSSPRTYSYVTPPSPSPSPPSNPPKPIPSITPAPKTSAALTITGGLRFTLRSSQGGSRLHVTRDRHHRPVRITATLTLRDSRGHTAHLTVSLRLRGRHWTGTVRLVDTRAHVNQRFALAGTPRIARNGTVTGTARATIHRRRTTLRFTLTPPSATTSAYRALAAAIGAL